MIIKDSLKDVFKTGQIKNIHLGMSRDELLNTLGQTDFTENPSEDGLPSCYVYGQIEIDLSCSKNEKAKVYQIRFIPGLWGNRGNLHFNYNRWTSNTTIEKAVLFLNKNKIKFEEMQKPFIGFLSDDYYKGLLTESGIEIYFYTNPYSSSKYCLYQIWIAGPDKLNN